MSYDCTQFANIATGEIAYYVGSVPYSYVLAGLGFLMGLGKGGVPGFSTTAVAFNSLVAPPGPGCLDSAVAFGVPITFMADCTVVVRYYKNAKWGVIVRLLPATGVGVALGTRLMGHLSESNARLLIGSVLLAILAVNLLQSVLVKDTGEIPGYANSLWFACVVGVIGGFATILTNSMGPMLNVYLLTLRLSPSVFVGTRATFFTVINTVKIIQRFSAGTLSLTMFTVGSKYGILAVLGVLASTFIIPLMSKTVFMRLEYCFMTLASLKLIDAGLELGILS